MYDVTGWGRNEILFKDLPKNLSRIIVYDLKVLGRRGI